MPATKSKDEHEITIKWQHLYSVVAPAPSPTWLAVIQLLHKSLIQLCYFSSPLPSLSLSSILFSRRHRNLNPKKKKKNSLSHFVCFQHPNAVCYNDETSASRLRCGRSNHSSTHTRGCFLWYKHGASPKHKSCVFLSPTASVSPPGPHFWGGGGRHPGIDCP